MSNHESSRPKRRLILSRENVRQLDVIPDSHNRSDNSDKTQQGPGWTTTQSYSPAQGGPRMRTTTGSADAP